MFLMYIGISLILMGIMILSGLKLEQKNEDLTNENIKIQTEVEQLKESNERMENIILELQDTIELLEQEKEEIREAKTEEARILAEENKKKQEIQVAKANRTPAPNRGSGNKTNIFEATAYDLTVASCGKSMDHPQYGITASGYSLKGKSLSDRFIAVDPKVIKLGSVVHIEFFEPYTHLTGNYTAVDTGGAIKGNKVDIFFGGQNVSKEVSNFGRREVRVTY